MTSSSAAESTEHLAKSDYDHSCCLSGHLHSGAPTGVDTTIAGVPTYVTKPQSTQPECCDNTKRAAIIILTDVFGYEVPNTRLVADKFANGLGCVCYVPYILNGDPMRPENIQFMHDDTKGSIWAKIKKGAKFVSKVPSLLPWLIRGHGDKTVVPVVEKIITEIRQNQNIENIGAIGYCFGGRPAVLFGGDSVTAALRLDAFAVAHPSLVAIPADIQKITVPSLWLIPEIDFAFSTKDGETVQRVLNEKQQKGGPEFTYKFFPGQTHGFTVRGDESDPNVMKAANEATELAISFFKRNLLGAERK